MTQNAVSILEQLGAGAVDSETPLDAIAEQVYRSAAGNGDLFFIDPLSFVKREGSLFLACRKLVYAYYARWLPFDQSEPGYGHGSPGIELTGRPFEGFDNAVSEHPDAVNVAGLSALLFAAASPPRTKIEETSTGGEALTGQVTIIDGLTSYNVAEGIRRCVVLGQVWEAQWIVTSVEYGERERTGIYMVVKARKATKEETTDLEWGWPDEPEIAVGQAPAPAERDEP